MAPALNAELPEGFTARPATPEDAEAVTALIAAVEERHEGKVSIVLEDVVADYASAADLERDSLLVFDGGMLVAEMLVTHGRYADGCVHPDAEGQGIGTTMLRWSREVARSQGGTVVGGTVVDSNEGARELYLANGYAKYWESWILEIAHDAEPAAPTAPEGVTIRPFEPGEEELVHSVIEDAFAEWQSRPPNPFEWWREWALGRRGFEPRMLPVAVDRGEIVGAAYLILYPDDAGWVQQLAVRKDHRGRGLGRALLQYAFVESWRHGERTTGLSTDSRTGALDLYEHVGMRVTSSYTHYATTL